MPDLSGQLQNVKLLGEPRYRLAARVVEMKVGDSCLLYCFTKKGIRTRIVDRKYLDRVQSLLFLQYRKGGL